MEIGQAIAVKGRAYARRRAAARPPMRIDRPAQAYAQRAAPQPAPTGGRVATGRAARAHSRSRAAYF